MCLGCSRSLQVGSIVMFPDDDGDMILGAITNIFYQDRKPVQFVMGFDINRSKEKNCLEDYTCYVLGTGQYSGGYQETYKVPASKLLALTIGHSWNDKDVFELLKKYTLPFYIADKYEQMLADEDAKRLGASFSSNTDDRRKV